MSMSKPTRTPEEEAADEAARVKRIVRIAGISFGLAVFQNTSCGLVAPGDWQLRGRAGSSRISITAIAPSLLPAANRTTQHSCPHLANRPSVADLVTALANEDTTVAAGMMMSMNTTGAILEFCAGPAVGQYR